MKAAKTVRTNRGRADGAGRLPARKAKARVGNKRGRRNPVAPVALLEVLPGYGSQIKKALGAAGRAYTKGKKNPAKCKPNGKRKNTGRRKNPEAAAASRHEFFHGKTDKADVITDVTQTVHEHSVLSGIGKLHWLEVAAVDGSGIVTLSGFKGALVAQNEKGTQLFIVGGDQAVRLSDFGVKSPAHESEVLGSALRIAYHTTKTHLRPEDGGDAVYVHKFGGKHKVKNLSFNSWGSSTSRLPLVVYDVVNKQLSFAGGGYTLPDVGIDG